jgi:hypothetical protein
VDWWWAAYWGLFLGFLGKEGLARSTRINVFMALISLETSNGLSQIIRFNYA